VQARYVGDLVDVACIFSLWKWTRNGVCVYYCRTYYKAVRGCVCLVCVCVFKVYCRTYKAVRGGGIRFFNLYDKSPETPWKLRSFLPSRQGPRKEVESMKEPQNP